MTLRIRTGLARCVAAWLAFSAAAGSAAGATPAWPQATSELAPDPAARFGVLPNGLRYALMHNQTPKGQVVMRLQIRAGSMHWNSIRSSSRPTATSKAGGFSRRR